MIRFVIDEIIIKNAYPDQNALQIFGSINNMSIIYEQFFSNLFNFKATIEIKNLAIIRFWTDLTSLVAEKGNIQMNFLFKCSVLAQKIDSQIENEAL